MINTDRAPEQSSQGYLDKKKPPNESPAIISEKHKHMSPVAKATEAHADQHNTREDLDDACDCERHLYHMKMPMSEVILATSRNSIRAMSNLNGNRKSYSRGFVGNQYRPEARDLPSSR